MRVAQVLGALGAAETEHFTEAAGGFGEAQEVG